MGNTDRKDTHTNTYLTLLLSMNAQSFLPALLQVVHGRPVMLPSHLTLLSLQFLQAIIDLFRFTLTAIALVTLLAALPSPPPPTAIRTVLGGGVDPADKLFIDRVLLFDMPTIPAPGEVLEDGGDLLPV